jgi:hypothetical protein
MPIRAGVAAGVLASQNDRIRAVVHLSSVSAESLYQAESAYDGLRHSFADARAAPSAEEHLALEHVRFERRVQIRRRLYDLSRCHSCRQNLFGKRVAGFAREKGGRGERRRAQSGCGVQ